VTTGVTNMPATDNTHEVESIPRSVDVTVKDEKQRMGFLHWVGVVGIGTVLLGWLVPKMWNQQVAAQNATSAQSQAQQQFIQDKMFDTVTAAATGLSTAAEAMEDLTIAVKESSDQEEQRHDELIKALQPVAKQLDRVADAVLQQAERDRGAEGEGT
jgi:hypothetical protein